MKNENIKNKPKKCGRWLFLHSRFSKFSRGAPQDPPYKGNTSTKLSKSFFNNNNSSQRQKKKKKKKAGKPSPIETFYKKFIFRLYRNWKKEEGVGARSFFV